MQIVGALALIAITAFILYGGGRGFWIVAGLVAAVVAFAIFAVFYHEDREAQRAAFASRLRDAGVSEKDIPAAAALAPKLQRHIDSRR